MSLMLSSLCRANVGILSQKLALMDALTGRHGASKARELYRSKCPSIGASMGAHIRHSMDHMELAALVASNYGENEDESTNIHYDLRVRGGSLEHDMDLARERIESVERVFQELSGKNVDDTSLLTHPVKASFFLTADENDEFGLPSTIARELGFAAHHAIHHMAMIRIAAMNTGGLVPETDLPPDFGRAPSTIKHDRTIDK